MCEFVSVFNERMSTNTEIPLTTYLKTLTHACMIHVMAENKFTESVIIQN